jgi:two-component system sensor histidine kinase HydH
MAEREIGDIEAEADAEERRPRIRPLRTALFLGLGYFILCSLYIRLSSRFAAQMAASKEHLERIEQYKGQIFILVTTLAIFLGAWFVLRRLASHQQALVRQTRALLKSQRQAAAGIFASTVAHDIRNMLTGMRVVWDHLETLGPGEKLSPELLRSANVAFQDLRVLSERLLEMGREVIPTAMEAVDLAAVVSELVRFAWKHERISGCKLRVVGDATVPMRGNPTVLRQLLLNLLLNAADAAGGTGEIEIYVRRDADKALLEVHDNGPGIPEKDRASVFTPFYTTRRHGAGLGLLAVRAYVQAHRGSIDLRDSHLGGACVHVELPVGVKDAR